MNDSTVKYVIRADDMSLANGVYYMREPFFEDDDPDPEEDIAYHWATHPVYAHQYDSADKAREAIRGLPTHAKPEAIPYEQALDEHIGFPEPFPYNVRHMPSDADVKQEKIPKGPDQKYVPFIDPPV